MSKPREFWVCPTFGDPNSETIRVIEKSAYDELKAKADKLAAALEWYETNCIHDYGLKAEQALKEYRGEE